MGLDIAEVYARYRQWYEREYCPGLEHGGRPKFYTFPEWVLTFIEGAEPSSIEIFYY